MSPQSATSPDSGRPSVIDDLLNRRVLLALGKGGAGRTAFCAAISLLAAQRGNRTLVIETDPQRPIAGAYGKTPGLQPVELEPRLWALFLGGQESLEDYLGMVVPRPILKAVFASSLYQYFVSAAPGLRELAMMGKIYHEIERRPKAVPAWNLIVVDTPASGQALNMMRMPFAARESFGDGLVGREAREVAGFFRDAAKCAFVAITTGEEFAVAETLEINHALESVGLRTGAVIFNRAMADRFEAPDILRLAGRMQRAQSFSCVDELAEIARAGLRRRTRQKRAWRILENQIAAPLVAMPETYGFSGRKLAAELAACLLS